MVVKIRNIVTEKEAVQFTGNNTREVAEFIAGGKSYQEIKTTTFRVLLPMEPPPMDVNSAVLPIGAQARYDCAEVDKDQVRIPTLEGVMTAKVGDWIIKGLRGEFYPCKPDIFERSYEVIQ